MANTAKGSFRVEHHGGFCIIHTQYGPLTVTNAVQLWKVLRGEITLESLIEKQAELAPKTMTKAEYAALLEEKTKEFLARGGEIKKVSFPKPPKPLNRPDITLEFLGLDAPIGSAKEPELTPTEPASAYEAAEAEA